MAISKWIDKFNEEKGIDLEHAFEIEKEGTWNLIPVGVVVEHIKIAPAHEQAEIKKTLVFIDLKNGDVYDFYKHLAGAIATSLQV